MRFELPCLVDAEMWALVGESRAFYAQRPAGRGPGSFDELRRIRVAAAAPTESLPSPTIELVRIGDRSVPIRIHMPVGTPASGVFLELHGGGFYMGSADALDIAVLSVDYRLAPEHPWPAAPDDCETAALWLAENAESRFGTSNLAIGGFSAGATLAVATLLRLRDDGNSAFSAGVLQFGTYDLAAQTPAGGLIADEYFLDAYADTAPDRTNPDISPLFPSSAASHRCSSLSAAMTSFSKTTSPWPHGCRLPASKSNYASIRHHPTVLPGTPPRWHKALSGTSTRGYKPSWPQHAD